MTLTQLILLAAGFSLTLGIYVLLVSGSWNGWHKIFHIVALVSLLIGQAITYSVMLGHAKPASWGLAFKNAMLIDVVFDEPRAIYVWVKLDDVSPPMAYQFSWDEITAKMLFELMGMGGGIGVDFNQGGGIGTGIPVFHPQAPTRFTDKENAKQHQQP